MELLISFQLLEVFTISGFENLGRIAACDAQGRDIADNDASRLDNGPFTYPHATENDRAGPDPHEILDDDILCDLLGIVWDSGSLVVVALSDEQQRVPRMEISADGDLAGAIDADAVEIASIADECVSRESTARIDPQTLSRTTHLQPRKSSEENRL